MKGMGQLTHLLKEAQNLQAKVREVQETLADREVEGSAGGGMVIAKVNGRQEVLSIKIEPEVMKDNDIRLLQDLIVAAVNQGLKASQDLMQQELSKTTGSLGLKIPGIFG